MFDGSRFRGKAFVGVPSFMALPSTFVGWSWVADIAGGRSLGIRDTRSVLELALEADIDLSGERARVGDSTCYVRDPWPSLNVGRWFVAGGPEAVFANLPKWIDERPFVALMELIERESTSWGYTLSEVKVMDLPDSPRGAEQHA